MKFGLTEENGEAAPSPTYVRDLRLDSAAHFVVEASASGKELGTLSEKAYHPHSLPTATTLTKWGVTDRLLPTHAS